MKFPAFIPTPAYCEIIEEYDKNFVRIDLIFDPIAKADIDSFDRKNIVIFTQEQWEKVLNNINQLMEEKK